jgi:hypothetical protein
MGPISWSVSPWQAFPAQYNVVVRCIIKGMKVITQFGKEFGTTQNYLYLYRLMFYLFYLYDLLRCLFQW